jgi:hypothetical protein
MGKADTNNVIWGSAFVAIFVSCGGISDRSMTESQGGSIARGGATSAGGAQAIGGNLTTSGMVATGGTPLASTGGTNSSTGGSTGASTGGGTSTGTLGTPLCGTTAAGDTITLGTACVATDAQLCYRVCGVESKGFKSETCSGGVYSMYAEQSGCSFPTGVDYSCYKIPTTYDATCPASTAPPQSGQSCTVAACVVCGPNFIDSTGAYKDGYCVCTTASKWSCTTAMFWPCPAGQGCT